MVNNLEIKGRLFPWGKCGIGGRYPFEAAKCITSPGIKSTKYTSSAKSKKNKLFGGEQQACVDLDVENKMASALRVTFLYIIYIIEYNWQH